MTPAGSLTYLEAAALGVPDGTEISLEDLERAVDQAMVRYDRAGDQHYDVISAFIKSIRGSDADAALHYLARMIEAGEDPRFIARRLIVHASEDIGLADPTALQAAVAAAQAVEFVGLPEARINLAQAVIHLSLAPKSNAVIAAIGAASADVKAGLAGPVPAHLRDAHYPGAQRLGHGQGYSYPHDDPAGVVTQQYAPDAIDGRAYYRPTRHGAEARYAERSDRIREILRPGRNGSLPAEPAAERQCGGGRVRKKRGRREPARPGPGGADPRPDTPRQQSSRDLPVAQVGAAARAGLAQVGAAGAVSGPGWLIGAAAPVRRPAGGLVWLPARAEPSVRGALGAGRPAELPMGALMGHHHDPAGSGVAGYIRSCGIMKAAAAAPAGGADVTDRAGGARPRRPSGSGGRAGLGPAVAPGADGAGRRRAGRPGSADGVGLVWGLMAGSWRGRAGRAGKVGGRASRPRARPAALRKSRCRDRVTGPAALAKLLKERAPMSAGQLAALIAAGFFGLLACAGVFVLIRLGKLLGVATQMATRYRDRADILLDQAQAVVDRTNEQLARTDSITASMDEVTANMAELSGNVSVLAGSPAGWRARSAPRSPGSPP